MRTPEQGHTKSCMARSIICAVENIRDLSEVTDHEFRLQAQDNSFMHEADRYLDEGILDCICPPYVPFNQTGA